MRNPAVPVRSRRWPLFVPFGILVVLAGLWCGAWFYLAAQAQDRLADWRAREADAGRVYGCGTQTIGGFPFRIELNCADPSAQFTRVTPSFAVKSANTLFAWQVYQPNLVIGEFTGPLVLGELGRPASLRADWHLADASIRIATTGLERVSVVFEQPTVDRGGPDSGLFAAQHAELHGRPSAEASTDKPAIDVVLRLVSATAPALHPLTARPFDAEINGVLRGAVETPPKPWPVLLREWQARGGSLQIDQARVQQDDVVATGTGMLSLTARGGLNGRMQVTVVGLDKILQALGLDQVVAQGDVGSAINALDRLLPGLGQVARQNAGASIVAGLGALGQGAQLEGKPAVTVPLRFDDGAVTLGPFLLGRVPPLF
jgi:hypothetical protein